MLPSKLLEHSLIDICFAVWNKIYRQGGNDITSFGLYPTSSDATLVLGPTPRRINTALAGFILLSIFNTLLLAILGTAPTVTRAATSAETVRSTRGAPAAAPVTGAAVPAAVPAGTTTATPAAPYATSAAVPAGGATGGIAGAGQTVV